MDELRSTKSLDGSVAKGLEEGIKAFNANFKA